jgi:aromatic-L-amino-acid decarboxylase
MTQEETLDPADWEEMRSTAYRMVDEAITRLSEVRDAPVWQDMPEPVRAAYREPLP